MTHLGERITDFIFKELPAEEMMETERHLAECTHCRQQVQHFQRMNAMLKTSPDVEPPRRIVFEVEKPRRIFSWRWAAPLSAAAALVLVVLLAAPVQIRWSASALTITFGAAPPLAPASTALATQPPAASATVQPIDYDRIIREVRQSQDVWLASELRKRDFENTRDLQRLQGELVYIDSVQRSMLRETIENASSIQLLAQKDE